MISGDKRPARSAPLFLRMVTPLLTAHRVRQYKPASRSVFLLSTGRTGTVYIADLLNQVDGVLALHEPKPSRVLNAWTTAYMEGRISVRYMAAALSAKRRKLFAKLPASLRIYVESNNFVAGFAPALPDVVDDPVVIHIVRDPRDFVTSLTNRGDDAGIRGFFNRYVPYWAYLPPGVRKRSLTRYTRPAYRWVAINQLLSDYGRSHKNYYCFKFEELFDKANQTKLHELLQAVGLTTQQISKLDFAPKSRTNQPRITLLDRPLDSANRSKHRAMDNWQQWPLADKKAVATICNPMMRRYGYGGETDWPGTT